jgi:hypothetical protein
LKGTINRPDAIEPQDDTHLNDDGSETISKLFSSTMFFYKYMLTTVSDITVWGSNNLATYYYAQFYDQKNKWYFSV